MAAAASSQTEVQQQQPSRATKSCWKKNSYVDADFFEGLKNHIRDFYQSPLVEHKQCFKTSFNNTYHKVFGKSEDVAEKSSGGSKDEAGSLPTSSAN